MKKLLALKEYLKGKKTFGLACIGGATVIAYQMGWVDYQWAELLLGLCGFGAFITLRASSMK